MPELPEVEVVAGGLTSLLGQRLSGAEISGCTLRGNLRYDRPDGGFGELIGDELVAIGRRGRYLVLQFVSGRACLVHLGMTGSLFISALESESPMCKHVHVRLRFVESSLLYSDPRRFGGWVLLDGPVLQHEWLIDLGLEPLTVEQLASVYPLVTHYRTLPLSAEYLFWWGKRRPSTVIKRLLMDNHVLTGVGNIYATEVLFAAGLHPAQRIGCLTVNDWQRVVELTQRFLLRAVVSGGSSIRDYRHSDGGVGHFQEQLLVYGRFGQSCPSCDTTLEKIIIDGRSSTYCPRCQPLSP